MTFRGQDRVEEYLDAAKVAIVVLDSQGRIASINRKGCEVFEREAEDLIGQLGFLTCLPQPQGMESLYPKYLRLMADGTSWPDYFENTIITNSGAVRDFAWHIAPLCDESGRVTGLISCGEDITERKRAEGALAHSHDVMSYVIEHARSAVAVHDRDMNYIYVSKRYLQEYGVEECEVIGKHHYDVFPDLPQKWREVHQRALAGEVLSAEDDPYERADGSVDWTRWECRPWFEADGSIGGIIVYTEVITDRRRTEGQLRDAERFAQSTFDSLSAHICVLDETGRIIAVNEAWRRFARANSGKPSELEEGADYLGVCDVAAHSGCEGAGDVASGIRRVIAGEESGLEFEYPCHSPEERRWFMGLVTRFAGEGPVRIVVTHRNVTEDKRTDEAAAIAERLHEFVLGHSLDELLRETLDETMRLLESPIGFCAFIGPDEQTVSLQSWSTSTPGSICEVPDTGLHLAVEAAGVWADSLRERRPVVHNDYASLEHRKGLPRGHVPVVRDLVVPITREGKIVALLGVGNKLRDYTDSDVNLCARIADVAWEVVEHKRVDDALRESEERFRLSLELSPAAVFLHRDGRFEYANSAGLTLLGAERPDEVLGAPVSDHVSPEFSGALGGGDAAAVDGNSAVRLAEATFVRLDGSVVDVEVTASVIDTANGPTTEMVVSDITGRKQAQEQLAAQAARLQILSDASRTFAEAGGDCSAVLEKVVRHVADVMADVCQIRMISEDGSAAEIAAQYSIDSAVPLPLREMDAPSLELATDSNPVTQVLRSGVPVIVPAIDQMQVGLSSTQSAVSPLTTCGSYTLIAVPLRAQGRVFGVMALVRYGSECAHYTEGDLRLARDLANRAALTISNAMLLGSLQKELTERSRAEREIERQRERLAALAGELLRSGARERRHVALELHDGVGQALAAAKLSSQQLAAEFERGTAPEALERLVGLLEYSIDGVRLLTSELSPSVLSLGLGPGLEWLADGLMTQTDVKCEVVVDPLVAGLKADVRALMFRTARELLNNVRRHSRAECVKVDARIQGDNVVLRVEDDGCGFDCVALDLDSSSRDHFGLFSIREEFSLLGGESEIDTAPGRGTRVEVRVPMDVYRGDSMSDATDVFSGEPDK